MKNKNFRPGKKASFVMKKIYNNNNMANLIKQHPTRFEDGDQYVEMVRLYEVKDTIPPEGGNTNPKDPYVKRSELRAELKALEDRIDVKFDEVNTRIDSIEDKFDKKLENLEAKFDKKFDEVNSVLKLILKKLNLNK